jgi:hypothetical protein
VSSLERRRPCRRRGPGRVIRGLRALRSSHHLYAAGERSPGVACDGRENPGGRDDSIAVGVLGHYRDWRVSVSSGDAGVPRGNASEAVAPEL